VWEPSKGAIKERTYDFLIRRRKSLKQLVTKLAQEGIFTEYKPQPDVNEKETDSDKRGGKKQ
jgi:hypothetical protein